MIHGKRFCVTIPRQKAAAGQGGGRHSFEPGVVARLNEKQIELSPQPVLSQA